MGTHPTQLIAAYADGELPGDETAAVALHLRGCARCRRELSLHQDLRWALGREPLPEASPGLRRRVEQIGRAPLLRAAPPQTRRRRTPQR